MGTPLLGLASKETSGVSRIGGLDSFTAILSW